MTIATKPKLMLCMGEHEWEDTTPMRCFVPVDSGYRTAGLTTRSSQMPSWA